MKILCFAFLFCVALRLQSAPAEFDVTEIKKLKDKVTVEVDTNRVVFNVHSSDGIGAFKAVLKSGEWPREVSVLLNIKGPEGFGFRTAHVQAFGGAPMRDLTNICYAYTPDGASVVVKAKQTKVGLELMFPPSLFADTKEFGFSWVDAWRR